MRKYLLIFSLFLFSTNGFSQVASDRFDEDGSRVIISKDKAVSFTMKLGVTFRIMDVVSVNDADSYFLLFTYIGNKKREREYSKGRKLLIKLKDDSIIELTCYKTLGDDDYVGCGAHVTYSVSEADIQRMIDNDVIKLRIENDIDYKDVELKGNLFTKSMKKLYEAVKEERKIEKKSGDGGLYEGF
ncbi:MAG: hypothetical protein IKX61_01025 [Prevotella sp.]|nr:hypothetical protein [Prevotella sp.]